MSPLPKMETFRNEPYRDFSLPSHRQAMEEALAKVRSQLGQEYDLWIHGERVKGSGVFASLNPSHPSEIVGLHQKADPALAARAVESAHRYFKSWSRTPYEERVHLTLQAARLLRERKDEFNAWLILEAGKNWPEAEADTSEAIDFCEYYARQMVRFASPEPLVQMPGEHDELVYLPLGAGVIIPPWNFPLAILVGMTMAALVAGNTVVIKPSSDTPTIAAKFVELLLEAGFPSQAVNLLTGSGSVVGDALVEHPLTRFVSFTGSKDVGLRINELAARPQKGQIWIKRVVAEMGGKDAIVVDHETDLDQAVAGVVVSAYGFQGQKCSACSRAIVDSKVYDEFLDRLKARVVGLRQGPAEEYGNDLGPVINERARKTILNYIEIGKGEGRLVCGGGVPPGEGYFVEPTVFAEIEPRHRLFQEEIFGPVLAVTRARDFDHALELANDSEYGLTGAVYTKNPEKIARAKQEFFVGNLYINRKCTGAMVGAHPFGGFHLSGTDSKAGGPDYLLQFLQAKSIATKL
ncbi:MAG: L-glutamate gamma-semialdehyde dehydrogenase [Bryobacteraceae bacterium]|nr:L-glutamate gamma-semialdehyde dehydrogenase [Bryobacteraceae bacterium]MDW8380225.1 L-glutamate gamma-semialdehyde dehydrogenase [Bryobacterales bacterium]